MGERDHDLVRLTSCANPVEAGALRGFLEAHGVYAHVQGEHHSSMLGHIGSLLIELNVLVPRGQLEEASELLEVFFGDDDGDEAYEDEDGEDDDYDAECGESEESDAFAAADREPPRAELMARRAGPKARRAAVLAVLPSFGFGHFSTGAFGRGAVLAAVEVFGIALLSSNVALGLALIGLAIVVDATGGASRAAELAKGSD